jgi:hypothetical protein
MSGVGQYGDRPRLRPSRRFGIIGAPADAHDATGGDRRLTGIGPRPVAQSRWASALWRRRRSTARPGRACASCRARDQRSLPAVSLLPAPKGQAADAYLIGNLHDRESARPRREKPPHMFERPATIAGDQEQTLAISCRKDDTDGPGVPRLARTTELVNPLSASQHWARRS